MHISSVSTIYPLQPLLPQESLHSKLISMLNGDMTHAWELSTRLQSIKIQLTGESEEQQKAESSSALSRDRDRFFFFLSSEHNRYAQTHVCAQMHFCLHAVHIQSQTWQHILTEMLMFLFLLKDNKTFVAQVAKRHYSKCTSK